MTEQISRGGDGAFAASFGGATPDGSHVFFSTNEALLPGDQNSAGDVYERTGDTLQLVSEAAPGAPEQGSGSVQFMGVSPDGGRVLFLTSRQLVAADTNDRVDVYVRENGQTRLLTGDLAADGAGPLLPWGTTADASHALVLGGSPFALYITGDDGTVLVGSGASLAQGGVDAAGDAVAFTTNAALEAGDSDGRSDVYRWTRGGTPVRLSTGNGAFDATGKSMSADGQHVFFETDEQLVGADTDTHTDVYEWAAGTLRVASTGGVGTVAGNGAFDAHFQRASVDGSRVLFTTDEALTADDTEVLFDPRDTFEGRDIFQRQDGTSTTLISKGEPGQYSNEVVFAATSRDATQVYFNTWEALTSDDEDFGGLDAYGHAGTTTRLISTAAGHEADPVVSTFAGAAQDGDPAYFSVDYGSFSAEDTDDGQDIYVRDQDRTALATTGAITGADDPSPTWLGVSDDGTRGWYTTWERAALSDGDPPCAAGNRSACQDVYEARLTGDPPSVTAGTGAVTYTEGDAAVAIAPALTLTAPLGTIERASVQISSGYDAGDELAVDPPVGLAAQVSGDTLTLTGNAAPATYEAALRSVTFRSPGVAPAAGARAFSFRVGDADHDSEPAVRAGSVVAIDSPAVLASPATDAAYTENGAPVPVAPALTVDDVDDTHLEQARVTIVDAAPGEALVVDAPGLTVTGAGTAVLQLTGHAPLSTYVAALRAVRYASDSDDPAPGTRTVRFVVQDGDLDSAPLTRGVIVTPVDDPPQVTLTPGAREHAAGGGPVIVDPDLVVRDPDDSMLAGATVTVATGYVPDTDVLAAAGLDATRDGPTLTLSGAAPLSTYRDVLRTVSFDTASPGPRTIAFRVADAAGPGPDATRDVVALPAIAVLPPVVRPPVIVKPPVTTKPKPVAPRLRVSVKRSAVVRKGRRLAVTCALSRGSLSRCTIDLFRGTARVGHATRHVRGRGHRTLRVQVPVRRSGRLRVRATARVVGLSKTLTARTSITVSIP